MGGPGGVASASAIAADQKLIFRLMRITAPHHIWGCSEEGAAVVDPVLLKERDAHVKEHPDVPWAKIQVDKRNRVRAELFRLLKPEDQKFWRDRSKEEAKSR